MILCVQVPGVVQQMAMNGMTGRYGIWVQRTVTSHDCCATATSLAGAMKADQGHHNISTSTIMQDQPQQVSHKCPILSLEGMLQLQVTQHPQIMSHDSWQYSLYMYRRNSQSRPRMKQSLILSQSGLWQLFSIRLDSDNSANKNSVPSKIQRRGDT